MPVRPLPLPWWLIALSPALQTAELPVKQAAWPLLVAYWASDLRPLPDNDLALAALCGVAPHRFGERKSAILDAFAAIQPALDRAHRDALDMRARRLKQREAATAAFVASRQARKPDQQSIRPVMLPRKDDESRAQVGTAPILGADPARKPLPGLVPPPRTKTPPARFSD